MSTTAEELSQAGELADSKDIGKLIFKNFN